MVTSSGFKLVSFFWELQNVVTWSVYCWTQTDTRHVFNGIYLVQFLAVAAATVKSINMRLMNEKHKQFPDRCEWACARQTSYVTPTRQCLPKCMVQTNSPILRQFNVFFRCAPCRRRGKLFSEIVCQSFYFVAIVTILNGVLCVNDIKTPSSDTKMNSQNKGEPKVETE